MRLATIKAPRQTDNSEPRDPMAPDQIDDRPEHDAVLIGKLAFDDIESRRPRQFAPIARPLVVSTTVKADRRDHAGSYHAAATTGDTKVISTRRLRTMTLIPSHAR